MAALHTSASLIARHTRFVPWSRPDGGRCDAHLRRPSWKVPRAHASGEKVGPAKDPAEDPYAAAVARLDSLLTGVGTPVDEVSIDRDVDQGQRTAIALFPAAVELALAGLLSSLTGVLAGQSATIVAHLLPSSTSQALLILVATAPFAVLHSGPLLNSTELSRDPRIFLLQEAQRAHHTRSTRHVQSLPSPAATAVRLISAASNITVAAASASTLGALCGALPGMPRGIADLLGAMTISALRGAFVLLDSLPDARQCAVVAQAARSADRYYKLYDHGARRQIPDERRRLKGADDSPKHESNGSSEEEACRAFRAVVAEWFHEGTGRAWFAGWNVGMETLLTLLLWQHSGPSALALPLLTAFLDIRAFGIEAYSH